MQTVRIEYRTEADPETHTLLLKDSDLHRVFSLLEKLKGVCKADVWSGNKKLGALTRNGYLIWHIRPD